MISVLCRRLLQQRPGLSGGHPEHPQTPGADRLPHADGSRQGELTSFNLREKRSPSPSVVQTA